MSDYIEPTPYIRRTTPELEKMRDDRTAVLVELAEVHRQERQLDGRLAALNKAIKEQREALDAGR